MKLNNIILETPINDIELAQKEINKLFNAIGLTVQFSKHFRDRIRNGSPEAREIDITATDLISAFAKLKQQYGKQLYQARARPKEFIGLLKDVSTNLNIPFSIDYDLISKKMHVLNAITIMRKRVFGNDAYNSTEFKVRTRG